MIYILTKTNKTCILRLKYKNILRLFFEGVCLFVLFRFILNSHYRPLLLGLVQTLLEVSQAVVFTSNVFLGTWTDTERKELL